MEGCEVIWCTTAPARRSRLTLCSDGNVCPLRQVMTETPQHRAATVRERTPASPRGGASNRPRDLGPLPYGRGSVLRYATLITMPRYRIFHLKESQRRHFQQAPPGQAPPKLKMKDYEPGGEIEAASPYAAWKQLREGEE